MKLIEEMRREAARIRKYRQGESCQLSLAGLIQDWSDALANSGALVPVRVEEPEPGKRADWYMTPSGLGAPSRYKKTGGECVETPTNYHSYSDCYPVRLVPIAEWEAEG